MAEFDRRHRYENEYFHGNRIGNHVAFFGHHYLKGSSSDSESAAVVLHNPDAFKMFVSAPPVRRDEFPYRFPPVRKEKKGSSASLWCFKDPELKRKKRVVSYNSYSIEGKVKASFKKGYFWIKNKCTKLVHGW